jgi:isopentenyl-diphosphate delta-isomerase
MDISQFESRKRDHIRLSLDSSNQALGMTGLEDVRLMHEALPELDWDEVSIASPCLGQDLATPFFVSGMTAGHGEATDLNLLLAKVCERRGWAMGVGSQRRELEALLSGKPEAHEEAKRLDQWESMRENHPNLFLVGNIGLAQLIRSKPADIEKLVKAGRANAFAVHLNVMQEVIQPEGTPQFKGGLTALEALTEALSVPVLVKETGCGMAPATLERLGKIKKLGAVDVSGLGGTHWGRIEGGRTEKGSLQSDAAAVFANWGVPTASSVRYAAEALSEHQEIWASGGVRNGHDAAKLVALGAHRVGYAKPALEAALEGEKALDAWMESVEFQFRAAALCTGCRSPQDLRKKAPWTETRSS